MKHLVTCNGCGVVKDTALYEEHDISSLVQAPVPPIIALCCHGTNEEWRTAVVCLDCFKRMDPDMWVNLAIWESISPVVPYENLLPHNTVPPGVEPVHA